MLENVINFFERYNSEPELREKVRLAVEVYPGSLEIREAVAKNVLLPVAKAEGLEFTIDELRKYETRKKMEKTTMDNDEWLASEDDGGDDFWLLDHGWNTVDES